MFDVDFTEMAVVAIIALLVVGPKDLPKLMRTVGHWVGRARGMARHVRSGFDTMVRESEIGEMNKRWEQQNSEIMAATRVDTWMEVNDEPARRPDPGDRPLMLPLDAPTPTPTPNGAPPPAHAETGPATLNLPAPLNGAQHGVAVAPSAAQPEPVLVNAPPEPPRSPPAGQLA